MDDMSWLLKEFKMHIASSWLVDSIAFRMSSFYSHHSHVCNGRGTISICPRFLADHESLVPPGNQRDAFGPFFVLGDVHCRPPANFKRCCLNNARSFWNRDISGNHRECISPIPIASRLFSNRLGI
jgi:hypothetical protein